MYVKEILDRHYRSFRCIYECEYCGEQTKGNGMDDYYYYEEVIPNKKCKICGHKTGITQCENDFSLDELDAIVSQHGPCKDYSFAGTVSF